MRRWLSKYWWVCGILGLLGNIWITSELVARDTYHRVALVRVGQQDSLALEIQGEQRLRIGEYIAVHYFGR